jgi:hypothetical protein
VHAIGLENAEILSKVKQVYLQSTSGGGYNIPTPSVYLQMTQSGKAQLLFSQDLFIQDTLEFRVMADISPDAGVGPLGVSITGAIGSEVGLRLAATGSTSVTLALKSGTALPEVYTSDLGVYTTYAGQYLVRKFTISCPSTCYGLYFVTSSNDETSFATISQGVVTMSLNSYCLKEGGSSYCTYSTPLAVLPGQYMEVTLYQVATGTYNQMGIYTLQLYVSDTLVSPKLPKVCGFFITSASCKG